jgi:hypothetical protein
MWVKRKGARDKSRVWPVVLRSSDIPEPSNVNSDLAVPDGKEILKLSLGTYCG